MTTREQQIEDIIAAAKRSYPRYEKMANDILTRIKTDTQDDVMLYHDAVGVLLLGRDYLKLLTGLEDRVETTHTGDALKDALLDALDQHLPLDDEYCHCGATWSMVHLVAVLTGDTSEFGVEGSGPLGDFCAIAPAAGGSQHLHRSDEELRMVIYANSNVTRGKYAAAAVHAALTAVGAHHGGPVIVLGAKPSEIEQHDTVIRDAGRTEVEPGTITSGTDFRPIRVESELFDEGMIDPDICRECEEPESFCGCKPAARPSGLSNQVKQLLRDLVDPDPCWFDHHGGCQAHGYISLEPGELCPHAEAKALFATWGDAQNQGDTDPLPRKE